MLRRLLLIPLLAPLLAVLLVGALNPRPAYRLRLLVWWSPSLPIGGWMALAAGAGALLSAGATALALGAGAPALRRQLRQGSGGAPWDQPGPNRPRPAPIGAEVPLSSGWGWPRRAPQDPPPTVSVPFRVIRTGTGKPTASSAQAATAAGFAAHRNKDTTSSRSASSPATAQPPGRTDPQESWESSEQDDW